MAELKTSKTEEDPIAFINKVNHDQRRKDAHTLMEIMTRLTGDKGSMWGPSIIGFGHYHYKYESGREADWFLTGFSPRKASLSLYIMTGFGRYSELLKNLGKYKTGKSCLYINKLSDVNLDVLEQLIVESIEHLKRKSGA